VKAKFVYEAIGDLFVPKSKEEILSSIEKRFKDWSPNEMLQGGVGLGSIDVVKYAVKKGADDWLKTYGVKNSTGLLWRIFNDGGNLSQEMILIGLQSPILTKEWKENPDFRRTVLEKTLYMGFTDVMNYLLTSEKEKDINPFEAAYVLSKTDSNWSDYPQCQKMLEEWLSSKLQLQNKEVNEALDDILKPKSEEEVKDVMKNLSRDEWGNMVVDSIHQIMEEYELEGFIDEEGTDEAFEKGITPPDYARQMIEKHYKEKWKPEGVMTISNTGGVELKFTRSNDGVEYRYTGEIIPHGAVIDYDYGNQEVGREDEDDEEGGPFFEDHYGNKLWLSDFMRV